MNQELIDSIKKMNATGNRLELPAEQISNYPAVKKALLDAGGKYKKNGFDFPTDAQVVKDRLCGGEEINDKKKYQFFPTPKLIADSIVDLANIHEGHTVLEPSAGHGALIDAMHRRVPSLTDYATVELMPENVKHLREHGYNTREGDFLKLTPEDLGLYDRIIANPPFTKGQDIAHVTHMLKFLKPKGVLVTVMTPTWVTSDRKACKAFRDLLGRYRHSLTEVKHKAFKESGTLVATRLLWLEKD